MTAPAPTRIRTDLDAPVIVVQTETDVGGLLARQDDGPSFRRWEVAGTAHFDLYGLTQGATDTGEREAVAQWFASMLDPPNEASIFVCDRPVNTGPQTFVVRAAVAALDAWVGAGTLPPRAARLETSSVDPPRYELDAVGNVRGGVRTPAVDAPVATLSGLGQSGPTFCRLFGTTAPLSLHVLRDRYGSQGGFTRAWVRATQEAVQAGFVLAEDAGLMRVVGAQADFLKR